MIMDWRDRLMMKLMGNRVVIKIFSIPIVVKILTVETQAFIWVVSKFKSKKEATG